jgi:hypothetical protein
VAFRTDESSSRRNTSTVSLLGATIFTLVICRCGPPIFGSSSAVFTYPRF